jgi:glycosyltransferase involved in cell wall biosynthesis
MGGQRITLASHIDDLDEFYNSLDVFVLPSTEHDPFGLVAAEAMVRGVPVVMTEACGIATEMEPDLEFFNAKPGSAESLKKSIMKMLDSEFRAKIAQRQQAKAKKLFSLETMVKRYEAIL